MIRKISESIEISMALKHEFKNNDNSISYY